MNRTRVGVVGAGVIARRHIRTLALFPDVVVAAVADVDEHRAREVAEPLDACWYGDVEAMLDREQLDAVYVCVPPFAHGAVELQVLDRRLPMFVEKPLAHDLDTALLVAERVAATGVVTGVGYHWRWLDIVERARDVLGEQRVRLASGFWLDATPPLQWWQRQHLSGGQLVEQATHLVDLARLLVGEVEEVFAYAGHAPRPDFPDCDVWDVTAATMRFRDGAVGSFASTCVLAWPHRVALHLFADRLAVELTEKELVVTTRHGREVHAASVDPFGLEDRAFVDAVQGGPDRTRTTYHAALRTHQVTTAAMASVAAGVPVPIRPLDQLGPVPDVAPARVRSGEQTGSRP